MTSACFISHRFLACFSFCTWICFCFALALFVVCCLTLTHSSVSFCGINYLDSATNHRAHGVKKHINETSSTTGYCFCCVAFGLQCQCIGLLHKSLLHRFIIETSLVYNMAARKGQQQQQRRPNHHEEKRKGQI